MIMNWMQTRDTHKIKSKSSIQPYINETKLSGGSKYFKISHYKFTESISCIKGTGHFVSRVCSIFSYTVTLTN